MRTILKCACALIAVTGVVAAQSPGAEASGTVGGKPVTIKYSAPSVRGRQIFGDGGVVSKDSTYPVWRAGANAATVLTTGANLDIGGLNVPTGATFAVAQVYENVVTSVGQTLSGFGEVDSINGVAVSLLCSNCELTYRFTDYVVSSISATTRVWPTRKDSARWSETFEPTPVSCLA